MRAAISRFAVTHAAAILFIAICTCFAGIYSALKMPSSVFPPVNFPRVVILIDNGIVPADEMMAAVVTPIEEAVKEVPGCETIRSMTGRGSAEVDVFFDWSTDMIRAEQAVNARLNEIRPDLPATARSTLYRMTFSVFPIAGISVIAPGREDSAVWETANYDIKPLLLRTPGVASVEITGGHKPEFRVTLDLSKLAALHLSLTDVADTVRKNNLVSPGGLHDEDYRLLLTAVDGRLKSIDDVRALTVPVANAHSVRLDDIAAIDRGGAPGYTVVTADGADAVLLNVFSQPDASTIDIVNQLRREMKQLRQQLPADLKLAVFYDQSLLVRESVTGVWEAIGFGLLLSVVIVFLFLKNSGATLVASVVIPVAVLATVWAMHALGMSFNLMTLGGIAAAVGLVIDDAIVVVESIFARAASGLDRASAVTLGVADIFEPLLGSTLTPVVVFVPLAFLTGIAGVFFRALALTMTVALLTSLVLALTLTPSLASWLVSPLSRRKLLHPEDAQVGGLLMRSVIIAYEWVTRLALRHCWFTLGLCGTILLATIAMYAKLDSNFLPTMDEGGFVIDYICPPGTAMGEIDREMRQVESILRSTPEVESYSRRSGTALGVALVEPNTGDFLVKLRPDRKRSTNDVLVDLRLQINRAIPRTQWAFPGILTDLIGDLTWEDEPIEIKLFGRDIADLHAKSDHVMKVIGKIPGVVDVLSGLTETGPSVRVHVRTADAQRFGLSTDDVAAAVNVATNGQVATSVLQGGRLTDIRVRVDPHAVARLENLLDLPLRTRDGAIIRVGQVAELRTTPGEFELHRDDLRQDVAVTAGLENRDIGSAMVDIRKALDYDPLLPPGTVEYGGLFQQQQESFHNLIVVLAVAIVLVFTVALLEFRTFSGPIAIVSGAVLSAFGIVLALRLTGTSLSIVTFLGALIGMGVVHKNGILMLDFVEQLRAEGMGLYEALVLSGRRRLRPVLMTSLAAAVGMLPLALGSGSSADMLRPLAISVIGAVSFSVLFSLVATPTVYFTLLRGGNGSRGRPLRSGPTDGGVADNATDVENLTRA